MSNKIRCSVCGQWKDDDQYLTSRYNMVVPEDAVCHACNTLLVEAYIDPWTKQSYVYVSGGHCPYCGGHVRIEDGYLVCVSSGTCTYSDALK